MRQSYAVKVAAMKEKDKSPEYHRENNKGQVPSLSCLSHPGSHQTVPLVVLTGTDAVSFDSIRHHRCLHQPDRERRPGRAGMAVSWHLRRCRPENCAAGATRHTLPHPSHLRRHFNALTHLDPPRDFACRGSIGHSRARMPCGLGRCLFCSRHSCPQMPD